MTRDDLKQIFYLNKEIKMWQEELDRIQCKSLTGGQEITGMPNGKGGKSDRVGDMAVDTVEIETIVKGKLAEIQMQRKKIMQFIEDIDDSLLRQIVFFRNVSCMNWSQVARELGSTENCVKQIYSRYFRQK